MLKVIEEKNVIEIQSCMPGGQRIFYSLLALFPLLAPYELIIRPGWHSYLNVFFLFVAIISAGAMAVSALFAWAAVAGLDAILRLDKAEGILRYSAGALIVRWHTQQCPIADITRLEVETQDWGDGMPSYAFIAQTSDGRRYKVGSSWTKAEIEDTVERVSVFLGRPTAGLRS